MNFIVEEGIPIDEAKLHKAELVEVKEGISEKYGDFLRFVFVLLEEVDRPLVSGVCPARLLVGNKLYNWLSILNGSSLDIGSQVDLAKFIGRVVDLTVKNIKDGDRTYTNVENLARLIILNDQSI